MDSHQSQAFQGPRVSWIEWTPGSEDSEHSTENSTASGLALRLFHIPCLVHSHNLSGRRYDGFIFQRRKLAWGNAVSD